jgi:hypothetical protein
MDEDKKRLFSNDPKPILPSSSSEFQTESMVHKIKKLNKKKKMENYKNIEVLQDIHDMPPPSDDPPSVVEGFLFDNPGNFGDDEYTGLDNVKDKGKPISPNEWLILLVKYIFTKKNEIEFAISREITRFLSFGDFQAQDVVVFKLYIGWFLSVLASAVAVYNWYYIIFHEDPTENTLKQTIGQMSSSSFLSPVFVFFNVGARIVGWADFFFTKTIKRYAGGINKNIAFILLFYLLIYVFFNISDFLETFMINLLSFKADGIYGLLYFVITVLLIGELTEITMSHIITWMSLSTVLTFIIYLVQVILYCTIVVAVTPFIIALCIFIYFFVYSFFGFFILKRYDLQEFIDEIHVEMDRDADLNNETFCRENTLWEKIMNAAKICLKVFRWFVVDTAFVYMLIYSAWEYPSVLKSGTLIGSLTGLSLVFILFRSTYWYKWLRDFFGKLDKDAQDAMNRSEKAGAAATVPKKAKPTTTVVNEPIADNQFAKMPTAETPTAEIPKAEIPTAETPVAEIPAAEIPTAETPIAETREPMPLFANKFAEAVSEKLPITERQLAERTR